MYRDAFKQDSKSFCRTGDHTQKVGCFSKVYETLELTSKPRGAYMLYPVNGAWHFAIDGKKLWEGARQYVGDNEYAGVNIRDFVVGKPFEELRGLVAAMSIHTTSIVILGDVEKSPLNDIEPLQETEWTPKQYCNRNGFIIHGGYDTTAITSFTIKWYYELETKKHCFTDATFRTLNDMTETYVDDLFRQVTDALEELAEEDEEIRKLIETLSKRVTKNETDIKNLQNKDTELQALINKILKYYNQTPEGNLQHKYDEFPMLFNSNYVDGVYKTIRADIMSGVVYYDLRMSTKVSIPANTFVTIAECPLAFMPDLSSPSSWVVRNKVVTDEYPEGTPEREPLLLDGKGVFAHTYDTTYGMVFIKTKDEIPAGKFLYLTGSYLMNPDNIGNLNLSKAIAEHGEFKLEENL